MDTESLDIIVRKQFRKICVIVFLIYCIIEFAANWSILIGENLMKWDIWDAELPNQVLMTDAIHSGQIILWNPLMQFGSPHYAVIGSPIYYPFTLILCLLGYKPNTIAVSYVMHMIIGAFGMFWLATEELESTHKRCLGTLVIAAIAGLLYGNCGLFLSNAEHIMIIISAAWIPWVFLFVKLYLSKNNILFLMMSGFCAGLILHGGYPEMFYNLFLFLAPYVLFFVKKGETIWKKLLYAVQKYVYIVLSTVLASAMTIIPFLANRKLITRGTGMGQIVGKTSFTTLLSTMIPGISRIFNLEISMSNMYMGILIIIMIPTVLKKITNNTQIYIGLGVISLLLIYGNLQFLHSIFYRFLPMYSDFRFSTLNRAFFSLFMILGSCPTLFSLIEEEPSQQPTKILKGLLCCAGVLYIVLFTIGNLSTEQLGLNITKCMLFGEYLTTTIFILIAYYAFFGLQYTKRLNTRCSYLGISAIIVYEVLSFAFVENPITVAVYESTAYNYDRGVKERIDYEFARNRERNRNTNFAGNERTISGLNSHAIVNDKTFDEEGYVSFKLSKTEVFKDTYLRSIMEQNPEAYFTDDIVTESDVTYSEWCNLCDVNPQQIYVADGIKNEKSVVSLTPTVVNVEPLVISKVNDLYIIRGELSAADSNTGRIRIAFADACNEKMHATITFVDSDRNNYQYEGGYTVKADEGKSYIDVFFPKLGTVYQSVYLALEQEPIGAELVVTEKMNADPYIDIPYWGFNSIKMNVDAPSHGYVTILQALHNGWRGYVDGKRVELKEVDECFIGIEVEAGSHEVVLKFVPIDFYVGLGISLLYLAGIIVVYIVQRRKIVKGDKCNEVLGTANA